MTTKAKKSVNPSTVFDYKTIKTFEDACKKLDLDPTKLPDISGIPAEFAKPIIAAYKLMIIYKAINNGWKPDWSKSNQWKYFPYYGVLSSGFGFSSANFDYGGHLAQTYLKTGFGAEIGVERGNFSKLILSQWKGTCLYSVDMWANEPIWNEAKKNLIPIPRCSMIKNSSVGAAESIQDGSLDFVYIDADHDYENCKRDIEAWFPKVRHGGLVAGHDYLDWTKEQGAVCNFGVKQAVTEFCVEHGYQLHLTTDDFFEGVPFQSWYFTKEIPRIIYYTWVSPDPLPERFEKYITAWKALMPDYDIRQISLENVVKSDFVKEAISRKLYSVAGHYGRCERLYKTGGIYFDIDIEAVKRFDDLLQEEFFVGCEAPHRVNNAVIGSAPDHSFMQSCLSFLDMYNFNKPGKLGVEIETGPELFTSIARLFNWVPEDTTQALRLGAKVFNSKYFYPYYFDKKYNPGCATKDTYAIHHWAKTW